MGAQAFQYSTAAFAALGLMILVPISPSHAQAPPLGTLANFAILANTGITNTGPTVITGTPANPGDIGSSLASITGFPPGLVLGTTHRADATALAAQNSLVTAYNGLAARTCTQPFSYGGTLTPGVYCSSGDTLFFTTTLDAQPAAKAQDAKGL